MRGLLAGAYFLLAFIGFLAPVVAAEGSVADIQQRLLKNDILRADFFQEKNLRVLSRPLESHGKFLFKAGTGVLWQIEDPYAAIILMKSDEIIEWDSAGEMRRTTTGSNPVFRAFGGIILAILSGDTELLGQYFELTPIAVDEGWQLRLQPKSTELRAMVLSILVFGDRFVEEVRINEEKGDTTKLQFSEFSVGPFELNEIEKFHLGQ
jgi:outer membrane lipoprotein-sorting protein